MSGDTGRLTGTGGPRIKVRITENDINWATRGDSSRCMVQLRNGLRVKQRLLTPEQNAEYRVRTLTEDTRTPPSSRKKYPTGYNTPGDVSSPPRVFKTKKRTYGHRLLRINQPMQATALDEPTE